MGVNNTAENDSSMNSFDEKSVLMAEYMRLLQDRIPLIVIFSVITVVGIMGNILTIIFYERKARKTPTVVLIKYLAIFDLIVCFLTPTTVIDLSVNILFTNRYLCKVMYFLDHWFVVTSVFILVTISIDRYRKMCKPFSRQFTNQSAFRTVIVLSTISMIVSTHDFVTYDIVEVTITSNVGNTTGHYCTNTNEEDLHVIVVLFHVLDACTILMSFLTFTVLYGHIWFTLRTHNRNKFISYTHKSTTDLQTGIHSSGISLDAMSAISNNPTNQSSERIDQSNGSLQIASSNQAVVFKLGGSYDKLSNLSFQNALKNSCQDLSKRGKTSPSAKHSKTDKSEQRLTAMMFAVTVAFCICFIPYFVVIVFVRLWSKETEDELNTMVEFALRSPFWNSVINPIIFCVFNTQYRQYVKNIFTKCNIGPNDA